MLKAIFSSRRRLSHPGDSEGEWKETIIYGEDGPWPSIHLPWDDSRAIFGIAATHLGVEVAQIEYLHHVGYPPEDLRSQGL